MADKPKPPRKNQENQAAKRSEELQQNAQIAYESVPTQEEMLSGFSPPPKDNKPRPGADTSVTDEMDEALYEAAQQGNIGGD